MTKQHEEKSGVERLLEEIDRFNNMRKEVCAMLCRVTGLSFQTEYVDQADLDYYQGHYPLFEEKIFSLEFTVTLRDGGGHLNGERDNQHVELLVRLGTGAESSLRVSGRLWSHVGRDDAWNQIKYKVFAVALTAINKIHTAFYNFPFSTLSQEDWEEFKREFEKKYGTDQLLD